MAERQPGRPGDQRIEPSELAAGKELTDVVRQAWRDSRQVGHFLPDGDAEARPALGGEAGELDDADPLSSSG